MGLRIAPKLKAAIPNSITIFRILSVPAVSYFIYHHSLTIAFILYTAASVSDWVDGFLARRWNVQSSFGQKCDPLADKLLVITTYIMMTFQGFLPFWLMIIVITRDTLLMLGALVLSLSSSPKKISLTPSSISKINTFFQLLLIGSVFVNFIAEQANFYPGVFQVIVLFLVYITALTTIWSGVGYALRLKT